jgi:hypothetical protein
LVRVLEILRIKGQEIISDFNLILIEQNYDSESGGAKNLELSGMWL